MCMSFGNINSSTNAIAPFVSCGHAALADVSQLWIDTVSRIRHVALSVALWVGASYDLPRIYHGSSYPSLLNGLVMDHRHYSLQG